MQEASDPAKSCQSGEKRAADWGWTLMAVSAFPLPCPLDTAIPYIRDALFMFGNQLILCMMDELLADLPSLLEQRQRWPYLMDSLSASKLNAQLHWIIKYTAGGK